MAEAAALTTMQSYIENAQVLALAKKPQTLCEHFGIPVTKVVGVSVVGAGRQKSFEYQEKPFKRVELVAKAYYEQQGYEVSWSEGTALLFANVAVAAAVLHRIRDAFSISDARVLELYPDMNVLEHRFRRDWYEQNHLAYRGSLESGGFAAYELLRYRLDRLILQDYGAESTDSVDPHILYTQPPHQIRERLYEEAQALSANVPMVELELYMGQYMQAHNERYKTHAHIIVNYNEWSIAFAKRLLEVIGPAQLMDWTLAHQACPSTHFDLTLIDPIDKALKFVEVKNTDPFTDIQLCEIDQFLKNRRFPIELCLVQV